MKTALRIACVLTICIFLLPARTNALSSDGIFSDSAILIDAATGQILYDKNGYAKVYPASTTKIMTALLVSELCEPDEIVTVSQSALNIDEWNSSNIDLRVGERLTVSDALYALMLPSANDAANVLAEHVAVSQERFADMMNQRAAQIGARDTHFENAHGLHEQGHYTTSHDMALITQEACQNPVFMSYFGADSHIMQPTNRYPFQRSFTNYQYMLSPTSGYHNPEVIGGKVGFTNPAQHTMSTVATRDGRTLICVVMHSFERSQKFTDTSRLLEYGFGEFREVTLSASAFGPDIMSVSDEEAVFTTLLRSDISEDQIEITHEPSEDNSMLLYTVSIPAREDTLPTFLGEFKAPPAIPEDVRQAALRARFPQERPAFSPSPLTVAAFALSCVFVALLTLLLSRYRAAKNTRKAVARSSPHVQNSTRIRL